ncbi:MAG: hypothetical protein AAFR76_15815 [Planctomycetota bacterium]
MSAAKAEPRAASGVSERRIDPQRVEAASACGTAARGLSLVFGVDLGIRDDIPLGRKRRHVRRQVVEPPLDETEPGRVAEDLRC